jgi:protein-S-isoprenylcysteine O-methyltransferase Ste14
MWRARRLETPPVVEARAVFLALLANFALLSVFALDLSWAATSKRRWVAVLVPFLCAYALVTVPWIKSLMSRDVRRSGLVKAYRRRTLVTSGWSMVPLSLGFLGAVLTGSKWLDVIGIAFGLLTIPTAAPGRRDLERFHAFLDQRGLAGDFGQLVRPQMDTDASC